MRFAFFALCLGAMLTGCANEGPASHGGAVLTVERPLLDDALCDDLEARQS